MTNCSVRSESSDLVGLPWFLFMMRHLFLICILSIPLVVMLVKCDLGHGLLPDSMVFCYVFTPIVIVYVPLDIVGYFYHVESSVVTAIEAGIFLYHLD